MNVGVTGHQRLKERSLWSWVAKEIKRVLYRTPPPLIGITSLAIGSDQLFANSVLEQGGVLHVIVPFADYENTFRNQEDSREYRRLLSSAARVEVLENEGSNEEAYYEAGKRVVNLSDIIVAVWDGRPAAGLGGTGDIVEYGRGIGKTIFHINPVLRSAQRI